MGRKKRKVENNDPSSSYHPSAVDVAVGIAPNAPHSSGAMATTTTTTTTTEAPVVPPPHHPVPPAIIAPDATTAAANALFSPPLVAAVDPRRAPVVDPRRATTAVDPRAATMAARDPRFPVPPPPPPLTTTTTTTAVVKDEPPPMATATSTAARIKSATMIHASTLAKTKKKEEENSNDDEADLGTKPSSMYGLHSHSGDIVEEDIYVSSGSDESDDDDNNVGEDDEENDEKEEGVEHDGGDTKTEEESEASTRKKTKKETAANLLPQKNKGGKHTSPELVISTSKMGLMRRGGISSLLGGTTMHHRQWVRGDATTLKREQEGDPSNAQGTQQSEQPQNEEETITDPAVLLAIQQRKIEQAKIQARIIESSENAGRDPCLFSKRTAFDIRMDQIEDKPWDKGPVNNVNGMPNSGGMDITDYFNYGLTEEDWMEYAERQLAVRQELTDANKQKRLPDPAIVPVVPRAPSKQGDRVAVRVKKMEDGKDGGGSGDAAAKRGEDEESEDEDEVETGLEVGPVKPAELEEKHKEGEVGGIDTGATVDGTIAGKDNDGSEETEKRDDVKSETTDPEYNPEKIVGGAWGAGAAPDSVLLRLIQEQSGGGAAGMVMGMGMGMAGPPPGVMAGMHNSIGVPMNVNMNMPPPGMGVGGMGIPPPPPPPPPPKNVPPPPPPKQDRDSHAPGGGSSHGHQGHPHPAGNTNAGIMDWDQGSQNGGEGFHDRRGHGGSRGGGVGEDRHPHHPQNKFNRQGSNTNSDPSQREWSGDGRDNRDVGTGSRGSGNSFLPHHHHHSRHKDYRQQQLQPHDQDPYNNGKCNINSSKGHLILTIAEAEWKGIAEAKEEEGKYLVKSHHWEVDFLQMDLRKVQVVVVTEAECMDSTHRTIGTIDGVAGEEGTEKIIVGEVRRQVAAGTIMALLRPDGKSVAVERDREMITAILEVIQDVGVGDLPLCFGGIDKSDGSFPKRFVRKWEVTIE
ncbi:LOW QUALITY PROTEIN: hypothetical protein ACHAXS_010301 [Conticribra weissflogii]